LGRNRPRENRSTVGGEEQGDKLSVRFNIQNSILLTMPLLPRIIAASTSAERETEILVETEPISTIHGARRQRAFALRERDRVPAEGEE
jgi:hypothetical protein